MTPTVTHPEHRFFLHEGPALESLEDLFSELQMMEDWQFSHHVNGSKNDFSVWTRDVFGDRFLARNIERCGDKDQLLKLLFINLFR